MYYVLGFIVGFAVVMLVWDYVDHRRRPQKTFEQAAEEMQAAIKEMEKILADALRPAVERATKAMTRLLEKQKEKP